MKKIDQSSAAAAAASVASTNAQQAAKVAAESATIIAVVANDVTWIKKSLGGIESTLDEMKNSYISLPQHEVVLKEMNDHEERIRVIETRTIFWVGGLAVLTFLVPILIKVLNIF